MPAEHFAYLIEKYDLKKIRFHDLRHTCASLLLANGVPMKQIQTWLGYSTFRTTADIYAHLDVTAQIETGDVAANFFVKSSPDKPSGFSASLEISTPEQTETIQPLISPSL